MPGQLAGKVAFVTGGGRGLGLAMSRRLAEEGVRVFVTGRSEASLQEAVSGLKGCAFAAADVTDQTAMEQAVAQCIAKLGPIDMLINNAGIASDGPVQSADIEEWWRVMEVNVKGPLVASRLVLPGMLERGRGHVINIGSYMANGPAPMSSYATSKAALLRMTDCLAAEVIDQGVVVLALSPGFVRTDLGRQAEAAMTARDPSFAGFSAEFIFDETAICDLVVRVALGEADQFYGRMLHVKDELDGLIAEADEIIAANRYALVFNT